MQWLVNNGTSVSKGNDPEANPASRLYMPSYILLVLRITAFWADRFLSARRGHVLKGLSEQIRAEDGGKMAALLAKLL